MNDNNEIQYQMAMAHLENFGVKATENVDLTNGNVQRAILNASTRKELIDIFGEENGH